MDQKVTDVIRGIGIPAYLKGYYYSREAIMLTIENDDLMGAITTKLYPLIAEKHHTNARRVEANIRNFISVVCSRGNTPFINRLFGPGAAEKGITNKEFIATIADGLKYGGLDPVIHEDYPTLQD